MLVCTYHEPTKECFCGSVKTKSLGNCELCEGGGSGICTDHHCYKNDPEQQFPLAWHISPDTGKLERIQDVATA